MLKSVHITITGGFAKVKIYSATGLTSIFIASLGAGVLVGGPDLTVENGFRLGHAPFITLQLKNNDEVWAIAETDTVITMLIND